MAPDKMSGRNGQIRTTDNLVGKADNLFGAGHGCRTGHAERLSVAIELVSGVPLTLTGSQVASGCFVTGKLSARGLFDRQLVTNRMIMISARIADEGVRSRSGCRSASSSARCPDQPERAGDEDRLLDVTRERVPRCRRRSRSGRPGRPSQGVRGFPRPPARCSARRRPPELVHRRQAFAGRRSRSRWARVKWEMTRQRGKARVLDRQHVERGLRHGVREHRPPRVRARVQRQRADGGGMRADRRHS